MGWVQIKKTDRTQEHSRLSRSIVISKNVVYLSLRFSAQLCKMLNTKHGDYYIIYVDDFENNKIKLVKTFDQKLGYKLTAGSDGRSSARLQISEYGFKSLKHAEACKAINIEFEITKSLELVIPNLKLETKNGFKQLNKEIKS